MKQILKIATILVTCLAGGAIAGTEENAQEFMDFHQVEIAFHQAGSTKNLDLMLSLFTDDAVIMSGGKTYSGKDQIKAFWQAAGPFQPQNQWVHFLRADQIGAFLLFRQVRNPSRYGAGGADQRPEKPPAGRRSI